MGVSWNGGTQQPWIFLVQNDHFGVFWGYHHLRKHPYKHIQIVLIFYFTRVHLFLMILSLDPNFMFFFFRKIHEPPRFASNWIKFCSRGRSVAFFSPQKVVKILSDTLQGTNISPKNGILKMIFLFPRWDMLIHWMVGLFSWKESILLVGLEELLSHHATATFVWWYSYSYI